MFIQDDLMQRWWNLEAKLTEQFGKKPDMESILYLIGLQETSLLDKKKFSKEEKQDLMHVGICTILSSSGYYVLNGYDNDKWPHFQQLKPLPEMDAYEQENFLKDHILLYFGSINF